MLFIVNIAIVGIAQNIDYLKNMNVLEISNRYEKKK